MKTLLLMIQFMTRIPIAAEIPCGEEDFARGPLWFPVVGWILGILLAGAAMLLPNLGSPALTAVLLVVLGVLLTGGLHLDGLADTCDGLYSNRDRERILEIMKDSRIGAYGVLALIGLLAMKAALIASIPMHLLPLALLVMPVTGRLSIAWASRFHVPARKNGMGNLFIGKVTNTRLAGAFLLAALPAAFLGPWLLTALGAGLLFTILYTQHAEKILDGITGDILGAACELSEMVFLFAFYLMAR